ncbi:MAG TPA: penicillin-binding transpeptidase domain-containing protein, partial [Asticcacaulis sp.]|nr:penicillin-binding transpeptidase domain-containing protein [Asticcacaulis sp.]
LHGAIVTSCDVYFYQCALAVGPDKIADVARKFGLGQIFDIGISGQKAGVVPDRAWKAEYFKKRDPRNTKWLAGETPSMGIGQGFTNVNALQNCVAVSRLANGVKAVQPRLIKSIGGKPYKVAEFENLAADPAHIAFVRAAMADVTAAGGTAAVSGKLDLGPIMMAGKTGTAQAHTYGSGSRATLHLEWEKRDHAWFVAFAPADAPKYAMSVIVQHGGWGGSSAVPKAREIMRMALLKDPEIQKRIVGINPADLVDKPLPDVPLPEDDAGAAPPPPDIIPTST